jgi:hypothetical protein
MKTTSMYRIVIKLLATYLLITSLATSMSIIPSLFMQESIGQEFWYYYLIILLPPIVFLFVIFNTNLVMRWLNLHKMQEDELYILKDADTFSLLKLAIVIVGLYFFVDNISTAFINIYYMVKRSVTSQPDILAQELKGITSLYYWLPQTLKTILGYLMVSNVNYLSSFLMKKFDPDFQQKTVTEPENESEEQQ